MRIEELYGTLEVGNIRRETVTIVEADMEDQLDGGWVCTIPQSKFNVIHLSSDHIHVQLFDKWGNEVGSGSDFVVTVNSDKIIVQNFASKALCDEYKLIVVAVE